MIHTVNPNNFEKILRQITQRHAERERELVGRISLLERELRRVTWELAEAGRVAGKPLPEGCQRPVGAPVLGVPIRLPRMNRTGRPRATTSSRPSAGP
jgi:hypothetical protein